MTILTDAELAKIRERVSVAFVTGEPSVCNPPQYYGPSQGEYIRVLESHAALAKQVAADRRDAERFRWVLKQITHRDAGIYEASNGEDFDFLGAAWLLLIEIPSKGFKNIRDAIDATILAATAARQTDK